MKEKKGIIFAGAIVGILSVLLGNKVVNEWFYNITKEEYELLSKK